MNNSDIIILIYSDGTTKKLDSRCWDSSFSLLEEELTDRQHRRPEHPDGDVIELGVPVRLNVYLNVNADGFTYRNIYDICIYMG